MFDWHKIRILGIIDMDAVVGDDGVLRTDGLIKGSERAVGAATGENDDMATRKESPKGLGRKRGHLQMVVNERPIDIDCD